MKTVYGIGQTKRKYRHAVMAIGVFDGVHVGHQKLISKAVSRARRRGGEAIVMTFAPHPVKVLQPDRYMPYIVSLDHRLQLIAELGVNVCVVVHFTRRFAGLTAEKFVRRYIIDRIGPEEIVIGEEFCFGSDRRGDIALLKEMGEASGFHVSPVHPVSDNREKIGSTAIRKLIAAGELKKAKKYLGRDVSLMGTVIRGDGRGRTLGYPTANISLNEEVLPPLGVYAARIVIKGRRYGAMVNIGHRPSFKKESSPISLEVHIFRFRRAIYGQTVLVEFVRRIRSERMFLSKLHLIKQLRDDAIVAQKILSA